MAVNEANSDEAQIETTANVSDKFGDIREALQTIASGDYDGDLEAMSKAEEGDLLAALKNLENLVGDAKDHVEDDLEQQMTPGESAGGVTFYEGTGTSFKNHDEIRTILLNAGEDPDDYLTEYTYTAFRKR